MTKPQAVQVLLQRLKWLEMEMADIHRQIRRLREQMGHPSQEQIERAADMGKEIRHGCTEDP
jgi:hypothetical protein